MEELVKNLTGLINTYFKIAKIESRSGIAKAGTLLSVAILFLLVFSFFLFFLSTGAAWALVYWLEWPWFSGFLMIALFYGLLFGLMLGNARKITWAIGQMMERVMHHGQDE